MEDLLPSLTLSYPLLPSLTHSSSHTRSFAKLIWLTILLRVTGYCVKNYYMINRQARKRTQRNEDAFAAELSMGKMLKKDKKKD